VRQKLRIDEPPPNLYLSALIGWAATIEWTVSEAFGHEPAA